MLVKIDGQELEDGRGGRQQGQLPKAGASCKRCIGAIYASRHERIDEVRKICILNH